MIIAVFLFTLPIVTLAVLIMVFRGAIVEMIFGPETPEPPAASLPPSAFRLPPSHRP